jgi:hypothetical protein
VAQKDESTMTLLWRGITLAGRRLALPFRWLMRLSKAALAALVVCLFVLSVSLPVVTALSGTAFAIAATLAEAITSRPSVLKRQATKAEVKLAEKEAVIAAERAAAKTARKTAAEAAAKLDKAVLRAAQAQMRAVSLTGQLGKAEKELAGELAKSVIYKGKKRAASEAVTDAASRVAKRIAKALEANLSSMAGEAIPYVGATVIVASVGYDAYQSCEMVKELHDLDVAFNPDHAIIDSSEVCGMRVPTADELWASVKSAPGAALKAARNALPTFQWQAGWEDLMRHVPSADDLAQTTSVAIDTVTSWWPDFYWSEGLADLKKTIGIDDGQ